MHEYNTCQNPSYLLSTGLWVSAVPVSTELVQKQDPVFIKKVWDFHTETVSYDFFLLLSRNSVLVLTFSPARE